MLIKACAGGGGRGMRIVHNADELPAALEAARGEAERAFGDGTLIMEKYVEGARHIEVQILGDHHGNLMHLFERDCSIQRRYQKIIEECPAPGISTDLRDRMAQAALALAQRLGYTNAGTVEFLVGPSGEFYFIEVNTRIQVEHPVTEMITGLDLVQLQIEIAEGRTLPPQPEPHGHAIEARLYAEDPLNNFLPSTGFVRVWEPPENVRVDTAVEQDTEIGVYYDPLLAKVIAHAPDRETAVRKLIYALKKFVAQGVETNREFLIDVLETGDLTPRAHTPDDESLAEAVCAFIEASEHAQRAILPTIPVAFRNNPYPQPPMRFEISGLEYAVTAGKLRPEFQIHQHGDEYYIRSAFVQRTVRRLTRYPRPAASQCRETANSPMPGRVLRILVTTGQPVKPGDPLVIVEAMKMEQTIKTTIEGVVGAVLVKCGDIVAPGQMLVDIESISEFGEDANEHASGSAAAND
jgi:3-methylcrotonyl-CoA carboxylase alpha subunit/geranyl-CoA carboxylase alpha subunit